MNPTQSRARRIEQIRTFPRLERSGARKAAVALAVVPTPEGDTLVLTQRATAMSHHAGQYALPGGLSEPGEDSITTALRETNEEIGVPEDTWSVLGQLDDYVTARGTVITPVVLYSKDPVAFIAAPEEVDTVILIPLEQPPASMERIPGKLQPFAHPEAQESLAITLGGHVLFAPTGALVYQFLELWQSGHIVRVNDISEPLFATQ